MIIRAPLSSAGPRLARAVERSVRAASVAGIQSAGEQVFGSFVSTTHVLTGALNTSLVAATGRSAAQPSAPPGATSNVAEYRNATRALSPGQSVFVTADAGFASEVIGQAIFPEEAIKSVDRRRVAVDATSAAERAWR